jgi:hypothetical protein
MIELIATGVGSFFLGYYLGWFTKSWWDKHKEEFVKARENRRKKK